jgi:hypothetical protein
MSEESSEQQNESLWNFEEQVHGLQDVTHEENLSSTQGKEDSELELKVEEGSDVCVSKENKSEAVCSGNGTVGTNMSQGRP